MKRLAYLIAAIAAFTATACIDNDIPYPTVQLNIAGVEGSGFSVENIDATQRIVTLRLEETTDIRRVKIDRMTFDVIVHNTTIDKQKLIDRIETSREVAGTFDLRTPFEVTLSLYDDYPWKIEAVQNIERRFAVAGQVGASEFDLENRLATAYVAKTADLGAITVTELKLGPEGITSYSPTIDKLSGNFETVRFVDVTCHGDTEQWRLFVRHTDKSVSLDGVDAWSRVVWLRGSGVDGQAMGFRYRKQGEESWSAVADVRVSGGNFAGHLNAEENTTYEIKAYCGDEETDAVIAATESVRQLPNAGMEDWTKPDKPWLPFLSEADAFWGTGNNGAVTLSAKDNVTTPYGGSYGAATGPLRPGTPGKTAAQLESRYVAIKLAAGNLFTGKFAAVRGGTHGVVNFGRPFTLRPTALKVWVKYTCGNITDLGSGASGSGPVGTNPKIGDPDNGSIYIALGTWTKEKYGYAKDNELLGTDDSPVSIDTRVAGTFFNAKGADVIGYGERILDKSIDDWTQITIPIDYRSTDERPTHIIVVCSASRYGDYFTGSRQSKMWLDDFELVYDWIQDFD